MKIKQFIALALAIVMVATIFVPAVSAAGSDQGIDLTATINEPKPEIGITMDTDRIDFGELLPGATSGQHNVTVTNVGLKDIDVTATAEDDEGQEPVFAPGLLIDNCSCSDYSAMLVADAHDQSGVALHIPDDAGVRGAIGGSLTYWATEHQNGPTVLFDGSVELTAGGTFDYETLDGTQYTGLRADNDMGALAATGLAFGASDEWYPSWWLDSIDGIANEPWSDEAYSWAIFINDELSGYGLHDSQVVNGDNVKFYYLQYDPHNGYAPMIDGALYLVNIDVVVNTVAPQADFMGSPVSGDVPLIVHFYDHSLYAPTSWAWSFGDGATSTEQTPQHTYEAPGIYTVSLTATNSAGSDTMTKEAYITASAVVLTPSADFSAAPLSGLAPLTVQFTDHSTNVPTSWSWDFDNDGTVDSTAQSPSFTYNTPGTYTVKLTASNSAGSDDEVKTAFITVTAPPAPTADFEALPDFGYAPEMFVQFTDKSTGATSWSWSFGDGATSTERDPLHTYTQPGKFTVSLTVTNAGGSNTKTVGDMIEVAAPTPKAAFEPVVWSGTSVTFSDMSENMNLNTNPVWSWDFNNDGVMDLTYTEGQDITHDFGAHGTYTVTLKVTNDYGTDSMTVQVTV